LKRLRRPPRIKYLEAASAIGDGRVEILESGNTWRARVSSSDGSRVYNVIVALEDGRVRAYSSDNGTLLRGYVGYPILAVLMLAGLLPRDPRVEEALRGVPWKRLNETLRKYSLVIERVAEEAEKKGVPRSRLEALMEEGSRALSRLRVYLDESLASSETRS